MSEHITLWLEAYYDGELKGRRARQVEQHLESCTDCRAELESLRNLSTLLKQAPEPVNLASPETFVAQVGLRLPRKPPQMGWQKVFHAGWQWAPAGLLGAWAFVQAAFIVSGVLMLVLHLFPGSEQLRSYFSAGTPGTSIFNAGNLSGAGFTEVGQFGLDILRAGGPLGWGVTLNLGLTILLIGLYLGWLASWWIQKSNGNGQSSKP